MIIFVKFVLAMIGGEINFGKLKLLSSMPLF